MSASPLDILDAAAKCAAKQYETDQPAQVHELLIAAGAIPDIVLETGNAEGCMWVSQKDWVYKAQFAQPEGEGPHFLHCMGLDTVCDLFLNGEYLGRSHSMYLPLRMDVTSRLKPENELLIYFHRHDKALRQLEQDMPDEWKGNVPPEAMFMRMHDYGRRPKDNHGYSPIGPFDDILLESVHCASLSNVDVEVSLNKPLNEACVCLTLQGARHHAAALRADASIYDPSGALIAEQSQTIGADGEFETCVTFMIANPALWWPKNYGGQPLYRAEVSLHTGDVRVDEWQRPFGIRRLQKTGNMVFEVNGVPIRFWGANLAPIWGPSNRYNPAYTMELIEKIDLGGFNATRVWGPSQPYPDAFYDEFDRRGILVWQDFPTGGSQLPDSDEYRALLCDEAAHMVRRLKHHPCIYLWCGGNENIYMCELRGETQTHGFEILTNAFRDVCAKLDPSRYYHASCPFEGRYANDPTVGDSHGSRALRAFCPGEPYGAFFSENIRVYPPQYKSFHRWVGDAIWEEGYLDMKPFGCLKPMPKLWQKLLGNNGEEKFGPIWDYYAATDVRGLIYKFTAAAGQDIYQMYARSRRGNPPHKAGEAQFCRGQVVWKMNDPWPNWYCAFLDYYLEPSLPYYAAKRAVRPVWIDFEVADRIYLWGVNDTREQAVGKLTLNLYNLEFEELRKTVTMDVSLQPGRSQIIMDLDQFNFLHWFTLLYAELRDADGALIVSTNNYLTKENMLPFHDARIALSLDQDTLTVTSDKFARCVELSAGEAGGEFGWVFEDNYFDLFPFETKRVRIQRRGTGDCVRAQAQYSPHVTLVRV